MQQVVKQRPWPGWGRGVAAGLLRRVAGHQHAWQRPQQAPHMGRRGDSILLQRWPRIVSVAALAPSVTIQASMTAIDTLPVTPAPPEAFLCLRYPSVGGGRRAGCSQATELQSRPHHSSLVTSAQVAGRAKGLTACLLVCAAAGAVSRLRMHHRCSEMNLQLLPSIPPRGHRCSRAPRWRSRMAGGYR